MPIWAGVLTRVHCEHTSPRCCLSQTGPLLSAAVPISETSEVGTSNVNACAAAVLLLPCDALLCQRLSFTAQV
jgi:hypothetical protein